MGSENCGNISLLYQVIFVFWLLALKVNVHPLALPSLADIFLHLCCSGLFLSSSHIVTRYKVIISMPNQNK